MIQLFTTHNYISTLKENLHRNTDKLIHQIRKTISFNYFEAVDLLDYTAFIQPHEISIIMYSMDRTANEVFYQGEDSTIFAGSYDVIEDIEYFNVREDLLKLFWEFYERNDEFIKKEETQIFVEWFKDCWQQAGGKDHPLPAYFSFHDYDNCFDLHKNKWISDGDKWFD